MTSCRGRGRGQARVERRPSSIAVIRAIVDGARRGERVRARDHERLTPIQLPRLVHANTDDDDADDVLEPREKRRRAGDQQHDAQREQESSQASRRALCGGGFRRRGSCSQVCPCAVRSLQRRLSAYMSSSRGLSGSVRVLRSRDHRHVRAHDRQIGQPHGQGLIGPPPTPRDPQCTAFPTANPTTIAMRPNS